MNEAHLRQEMLLARRAQAAYDTYLEEYITNTRAKLFDSFVHAPLDDAAAVMRLKRLAIAICSLEQDILTVIETGKLAAAQLESKNG